MARTATVNLVLEKDSITFFESFVNAVKSSERATQEVVKHIVNLPNVFAELITTNSNVSAAGACEVRIRFEPTDCFNKILAAVRAGNIDFLIVEHDRLLGKLG